MGKRSRTLTAFLHLRMRWVALAWIITTSALAGLKLSAPALPFATFADAAEVALVYALAIAAPAAGYWLAIAVFPSLGSQPQPSFRLAVIGKWKAIKLRDVIAHPCFGPTGFMASLLAGLLINVVIRTGEFLLAIPAMSSSAPVWGHTLFLSMAFDVIVMNFFYMVCFVMALRSIPLFPRMLLFVWMLDVLLQLTIANFAVDAGVPIGVASHLASLLEGNIDKVLISAAIWLPYLILSDRVNLTYRHRLAA